MTPQEPLARARERSPAAIEAWLERDYPAIAKRARAQRAVIYWGDETGISNQDQTGRSYAPRGETPVIVRTAKRITRGMISAVSNRGLMRFMLYDGALNADRFIDFLRRLIKDAGRKVVLIVDDPKVHKAGKVMAWLASHAHEIALFYLPAYAPGHNPDEYLNHALKQALRADPFAGEVFIFRPKRADRVKILVHDGTGLVLYAKRLEAGRFCWPSPADDVVRLSAAQLATLLEGLPWHRLQPRVIPRPSTAW